ncbi:MAG: hypothetical protein K2P75_05480 [Sphingobacteriaceae bacterium]|nr:hypothetical protein [Sphingobacteriaceae bacterium]
MKKLLFALLFVFIYQFSFAQTPVLDKEKLLEFYQTQRYADAAQYLQSIYPADTKDLKALSQIAYCYMMSGKLPEAEKSYLKIDSLQPHTLSVLFSLANINSRRGNEFAAKFYLFDIIKLDSANFNAYKQLANYTDSIKLKIVYLKKANTLNATEPDVAYDLAIAYKNLKLFEPAYQTLKIAIAADTANLFLQQALLPIANELKKYAEVINIGEKLLKNGADGNVVKDVGKAYFYLKNYQKCIFYYNLLEKMDLQNESILYFMSLSYRELKNYNLAAKYAKMTIEEGISKNTSAYYLLLGGIYETNQQFINALNAYKKGLTFNSNSTIYYSLGLLYDLRLKQNKNALTYYKLYLKSKPDADEKQQVVYVKARITEITGPKAPQK